jgi:Domain of unknown function (DUF1918)
MKAHVGDLLVIAGDQDRVGLVIGLRHPDGSPPYVIRWLNGGYVALVFPSQYTRIVPAEEIPQQAGPPDEQGAGENEHTEVAS